MIKSMTGFGQATLNNGEVSVNVELRSLNSKFLDLNLKIPKAFNEKELDIRNLIAELMERGKVSFTLEYMRTGRKEIVQTYNETLFVAYYAELKKLADRVVAPYDNLFQLALNSQDVIQNKSKEEVTTAEWELVQKLIYDALKQCDQFRVAEGRALEGKLVSYINAIAGRLKQVEELDPKRVEHVRHKIKSSIQEFFGNEGFDMNRLEQEIIFYIEKLDIHEERVRLQTHLDYFLKVLADKQSNGKKLGFISQEIGREINTIGSKANDAEIQRHVVVMKEELEKIKEQLNNVL